MFEKKYLYVVKTGWSGKVAVVVGYYPIDAYEALEDIAEDFHDQQEGGIIAEMEIPAEGSCVLEVGEC